MKEPKTTKCFYCHNTPHIIRIPGDIFYAQCPCGNYDLYEFMALTKHGAAEIWNKEQIRKEAQRLGYGKKM